MRLLQTSLVICNFYRLINLVASNDKKYYNQFEVPPFEPQSGIGCPEGALSCTTLGKAKDIFPYSKDMSKISKTINW